MLNSTKELEIGQIVKSRSGRDKDKVFMVLAIVDEQYVLIVDGDLRKLTNPKKKKVKHLNKLAFRSNLLDNNEHALNEVYDAHIRKELEKLDLI